VRRLLRFFVLWAALGLALLPCSCQRHGGDSSAAADGSLIYASVCARCHGADGCGGIAVGSIAKARNLCDVAFQDSTSDAQIKQTITKGRGMMPTFGDDYNDEQLSALVRHIRSLKSAR
jgi:mono/diheme cytochrome c family protein